MSEFIRAAVLEKVQRDSTPSGDSHSAKSETSGSAQKPAETNPPGGPPIERDTNV